MTRLTVPIFVPAHAAARPWAEQIAAAAALGADMIELRADVADKELIAAAINAVKAARKLDGQQLLTMVTIRPRWEGGLCDLGDDDRVRLFEHALGCGADFLDIELQAIEQSARLRQAVAGWFNGQAGTSQNGCAQLVVSAHDFSGVPMDLPQRLRRLQAVSQAAWLKMVFLARSLADAIRALELYGVHARQDARPLLSLAMGEMGAITRLLAGKFGAPYNFAALPDVAGSAPGQLALPVLRETYGVQRHDAATRVFGVAGWPVGHSISPAIHNAGFAAVDFNGCYIPLPIEPDYRVFVQTTDALRACAGLHFGGCSVTIPHKENALRYARERGLTVEPAAEAVGAANTLLFSQANRPGRCLNTDIEGIRAALAGAKPPVPAGQRAAVFGAGGAARAVVYALKEMNWRVTVFNRTAARGAELVQAMGGDSMALGSKSLDDFKPAEFGLLVNCTPVGMHPNINASPLPEGAAIMPGQLVFDTVYNPHETLLLRQARAAGAKMIYGLDMLLGQAMEQFKGFTGMAPPVEVMRKAAEMALGS